MKNEVTKPDPGADFDLKTCFKVIISIYYFAQRVVAMPPFSPLALFSKVLNKGEMWSTLTRWKAVDSCSIFQLFSWCQDQTCADYYMTEIFEVVWQVQNSELKRNTEFFHCANRICLIKVWQTRPPNLVMMLAHRAKEQNLNKNDLKCDKNGLMMLFFLILCLFQTWF